MSHTLVNETRELIVSVKHASDWFFKSTWSQSCEREPMTHIGHWDTLFH